MRVIETFVENVPREKIPDEAKWFVQDYDGELKCSADVKRPVFSEVIWIKDVTLDGDTNCGSFELSTDAGEVFISRSELMLAYDLVEQGCNLWFGGCSGLPAPVKDLPEEVDIVLGGGVRESGNPFTFDWAWMQGERFGEKYSSSIIAWRPARKADVHSHDTGYDAISDLMEHEKSQDEVNHPSHYTSGNIECIDIIREMVRGKSEMESACIANIVKYLYRYKDKGGIKSVEKAQWYLNLMVEEMKSGKE